MSQRVEKKIWHEYFDAVQSGKKKFELRLNDFDISEGDTLLLREWDRKTRTYTGRSIEKRVTYVARFKLEDVYAFNSEEEVKEKGLLVISLE